MSSILAVFNRNGEPVEAETVNLMMDATRVHAIDGQHHWHGRSVALAHQHFWITPEEQGERQPLVDASTETVIAFDGRIDNRSELLGKLGMPLRDAPSDATLALCAYQQWGTGCAHHLVGDFVFVVWDSRRRQLYAARDALGGRQLCYYLDAHRIIIASEIAPIVAHPAVPRRLNEGKVAEYLNSSWDNQEDTFFEGIYYLPPAHHLTVTAEDFKLSRHWELDPDIRIRYRDEREYAEHFLSLLKEAVRCRMRTTGPIGVSMSGGMDSTSITAVAASLLPEGERRQRLKVFSYVFDELTSCDEREFIKPVVEMYGLDSTYILGDDKWPLRNLAEWPIYHDIPAQDSFVWLTIGVLEAARDAGCRVLFTGRYGDHLFSGADQWALDSIRELRLDVVMKHLNGLQAADVFLDSMRQLAPSSVKRAYRLVRPIPFTPRHPGLHPDFVQHVGLADRIALRQQFERYSRAGQWQRYKVLIDSGSSEGSAALKRLGASYAIEYANPFIDRRLVEFVMAVPADQLGHPNRSKRVLRTAMSDLMPEATAQRPRKTSLVPLFEKGVYRERHSAIQAILSDSQIVRRGFVQESWLRTELLKQPKWTNDGYFTWLCISLELWLNRHWPGHRLPSNLTAPSTVRTLDPVGSTG